MSRATFRLLRICLPSLRRIQRSRQAAGASGRQSSRQQQQARALPYLSSLNLTITNVAFAFSELLISNILYMCVYTTNG